MAAKPEFVLEARILDETDAEWASQFNVGAEWWSHELTAFLRDDALEDARQGLNRTVLFSFPGYREIVGFVTSSNATINTGQVKALVELPEDAPPRVPAVLIAYLGVAWKYRRAGHFGQEIHLQLLGDIARSWAGSRLIYIECWEDNVGGNAFWKKMGYSPFGAFEQPRPDNGEPARLNRLYLDRFRIHQ